MKKRVLSGIRATGRLHLGNYLGAVKGMLELQNNPEYETFYMVADLHTLTTPFETKDFQSKIKDIVLDYLSAGLDPEKCALFVQSHIKELLELTYLFSTQVTVARMQHIPTFKEKIKQYPKNVNVALLNYPVLMAADILLYKATFVPVGIDQEPHLEIAREVARKMNEKFGTDFPEPKRFITKGDYVPSLTGEGKMSKSISGSSILLTDSLETIKERLAKTPTDLGKGDKVPDSGGVNTLLTLVEFFEGKDKRENYEKDYLKDGIKYSSLKEELAEAIYKELKPIQERRAKLERDPEYIEKILKEGSLKATKVASETLLEVKKAMGLV
ncbi:tryptophan--tRNA ligase [Patescibacteria group bacterium]|nr:tryptophan--tRNA ligase [Patescibacteria group bacterium]MBU2036030.1 tryptophan--tRNA ligase [Patescibacteria group bacterium]